jgi:hypothetical protein
VLTLTTLEGEPFPLKPGSTWFEVISDDSTYNTDGVDWRFTFNPPEVPDDPIDQYENPDR